LLINVIFTILVDHIVIRTIDSNLLLKRFIIFILSFKWLAKLCWAARHRDCREMWFPGWNR